MPSAPARWVILSFVRFPEGERLWTSSSAHHRFNEGDHPRCRFSFLPSLCSYLFLHSPHSAPATLSSQDLPDLEGTIYKNNKLILKSEVDECEDSVHSSRIADGQRFGYILKIARRMQSNTFTVHRVMCRSISWWNRCKQRFIASEASLLTLRSADFEIRTKFENSGMISLRERVEQQCDEGWMNGENVHRWVALK